ncbi:MAG: hypothetical protein CVU24_12325 [Betaproteobacteria bacterium HGW-Betaproteobacteria-18]|nr:MAG: hypothetical protein CVU24_12325 [Betaproteobacteria bacterium HGW-Betaproteobacteria-18]
MPLEGTLRFQATKVNPKAPNNRMAMFIFMPNGVASARIKSKELKRKKPLKNWNARPALFVTRLAVAIKNALP